MPPWDEASKNFSFSLYAALRSKLEIMLLTVKNTDFSNEHKSLPIYSSSHLSIMQKIKLIKLYFIKDKFDLIHILLTPTKVNSPFMKLLVRRHSAKCVQTVATVRSDVYNSKQLKNLFFGDSIVTYSEYNASKLKEIGIQNVTTIYPGIDLKKFKPTSVKRNRFHPNSFVVTYPGEYTRLGATDMIISSFIELSEEIPSLVLVMACRLKNGRDVEKKKKLETILTKAGLRDRVVMTDTVEDMASLYNESDIVIFPVKDMNGKFDVPLAVIEAMACALPVVISNLDILTEFASEETSVPINPNKEELSEAILKLFHNQSRRKSLGLSANNYVVKNFDINNISKKYESIYKEIIK